MLNREVITPSTTPFKPEAGMTGVGDMPNPPKLCVKACAT